MPKFVETTPKDETIWRSIILFGRNVASYIASYVGPILIREGYAERIGRSQIKIILP